MDKVEALTLNGPARIGRPLDLDADIRILEAALTVYGLHGWDGLTMNAIGREAKVGKALLYSRFRDPGSVLEAAFERYVPILQGEYTSVRELLLAEVRRMGKLFLSDHALAIRRVAVDAAAGLDVAMGIQNQLHTRIVRRMRGLLHVAIADGELPARTSVTMLLDILEGGIQMHTTARPELREQVEASLDSYTERLVDGQLLLLQVEMDPVTTA